MNLTAELFLRKKQTLSEINDTKSSWIGIITPDLIIYIYSSCYIYIIQHQLN
nr:MAG TPA: hypothetical protein [Caudoviricetes sp.]